MEVDVREENGKMILSPSERNHSLMNALKRAVWDAGGKSGYNQGHPYEGESGELVVDSDSPGDTLEDAIDILKDDLAEFRDAFDSA